MPAAPSAYPLDPMTINSTTGEITVDELVNDPSRITRDIADLSVYGLYMGEIFTDAGGVEGGALLFERPANDENDLFALREPKEIAPGAQFPLQEFQRGVPMLARPRKIGNKWNMTKEAIKRNKQSQLRRHMQQTANTIRRRIENMGLAELAAVVAAEGRFETGTSWSAFAALTAANRTSNAGPVADVMAALAATDAEEHGVELDSMLINPLDAINVKQAYPGQSLSAIFSLSDLTDDAAGRDGQGIRNIYTTFRHPAGKVTLFESGNVGEWRNEFPLEEETEWEGPASSEGQQRWWYSWSWSPLFAVENQFAIREIRGIA